MVIDCARLIHRVQESYVLTLFGVYEFFTFSYCLYTVVLDLYLTFGFSKSKIFSVHAMETCGKLEARLRSFLNSALGGGDWQVSRPSRFTTGEGTRTLYI